MKTQLRKPYLEKQGSYYELFYTKSRNQKPNKIRINLGRSIDVNKGYHNRRIMIGCIRNENCKTKCKNET